MGTESREQGTGNGEQLERRVGGKGTQDRVALLMDVARGFTGERSLDRVFATEGEIGASDGAIIFRAWAQGLSGDDPRTEGPLHWSPGPATRISAREWIAGEFAGAIRPVWANAHEKLLDQQRDFDADARPHRDGRLTDCPCCGEELVIHDDGSIESLDQWREENRPDRSSMPIVAALRLPGRDEVAFSVWYLAMALAAAGRLGGAESLEITEDGCAAVFRGADWFIAIAKTRIGDGGHANIVIDVPEFGRDLTLTA